MGSDTDKMAIAGGTLLGLAALARGSNAPGPGPGPAPGPGPGPIPGQQQYRDSSGTVDAVFGRVLFGPNAARTALIVVNDGDDTVYVSFGPGPTVHTGVRLNSNGGSMILEGFGIWFGPVSAISLSSDTAVTATEVYNT